MRTDRPLRLSPHCSWPRGAGGRQFWQGRDPLRIIIIICSRDPERRKWRFCASLEMARTTQRVFGVNAWTLQVCWEQSHLWGTAARTDTSMWGGALSQVVQLFRGLRNPDLCEIPFFDTSFFLDEKGMFSCHWFKKQRTFSTLALNLMPSPVYLQNVLPDWGDLGMRMCDTVQGLSCPGVGIHRYLPFSVLNGGFGSQDSPKCCLLDSKWRQFRQLVNCTGGWRLGGLKTLFIWGTIMKYFGVIYTHRLLVYNLGTEKFKICAIHSGVSLLIVIGLASHVLMWWSLGSFISTLTPSWGQSLPDLVISTSTITVSYWGFQHVKNILGNFPQGLRILQVTVALLLQPLLTPWAKQK